MRITGVIYRFIIVLFSTVFLYYIICFFAVDMCCIATRRCLNRSDLSVQSIDRAWGYIDTALEFVPDNAELHYQKYELLDVKIKTGSVHSRIKNMLLRDQAELMAKAIELEPTRAVYHMLYALTHKRLFLKERKRDREDGPDVKRLIKQDLHKACELKSFSSLYKEICYEYRHGKSL